jgi:hypothetical protein
MRLLSMLLHVRYIAFVSFPEPKNPGLKTGTQVNLIYKAGKVLKGYANFQIQFTIGGLLRILRGR